ncbi:hypothetical protein [Lactococcus garvieae]|uniref:hypothetical protein n=1 Tax=Lactococcus garvieae TaxID=1363 RepID=UPI00385308EA
MNEKKYYVGLKSLIDENIITHFLWKDYRFYPGFEKSSHSFTKSELAEIRDGALYKKADYCEFMELPPDWIMNNKEDKWLCEWINPLIELVPVEEEA